MKQTRPGISELPRYFQRKLKKKRLGILCHPASINRQHRHLLNILEDEGAEISAIFGPQHGVRGETQDNMIEWEDFKDEKGRPVYSLYGKTRIPTEDSLRDVDVMIVDLQDVGCRIYTFIYTLYYMMMVCGRMRIPVIVCDRPNPIGGDLVEGPILNPDYQSFVGLHPLPIVHGMTIGEIANFFLGELDQKPPLEILKLKNWNRKMHWPGTGLTWVPPSPNLPTYEGCLLFPGMVLLEGTSLSEGRGTTRPFELIGAPFLNWDEIEKKYEKGAEQLSLPPLHFHRQGFIPTFHKHQGELCLGALQIVEKPKKFLPLRSGVLLLWILRDLYGDAWGWTKPPYEYEREKRPIDIITGGPQIRETIDSQAPLKKLFRSWQDAEIQFRKHRKAFLLY